MASQHDNSIGDLTVDHVRFYVRDLDSAVAALVEGYGFEVYATSGERGRGADFSAALGRDRIRLVLTTPQTDDHPGAMYVEQHGDGVADIALRSTDAAADFAAAVARGARPVAEPATRDGMVTATIVGFGDVLHTFVQRPAELDPRVLPGFVPASDAARPTERGLLTVDHFAVCLEAGQLTPTVQFYEEVLGFRMIFTERITVGEQAMDSQVVQSGTGGVTLTLIEPDTSMASGQIDEFIKNHGGAGVQHVAFTTDDIVRTIGEMVSAGVEFLATPGSYYRQLTDRLELASHSVAELRELNVLADADHDGQLFQIFARSVHPRGTFFFEVIERLGATTFGSGNIKALYEAVESERQA